MDSCTITSTLSIVYKHQNLGCIGMSDCNDIMTAYVMTANKSPQKEFLLEFLSLLPKSFNYSYTGVEISNGKLVGILNKFHIGQHNGSIPNRLSKIYGEYRALLFCIDLHNLLIKYNAVNNTLFK